MNMSHKIRLLAKIIFIDSTGVNRSSIPEGGQMVISQLEISNRKAVITLIDQYLSDKPII